MPAAKPPQTGGDRTAVSRQRKPPKPRHVPQRTCIACKEVRPKRELIRVVRTPEGHIEIDATGKKSGRGAYLCARRSCWEPALRRGRLEQEFGITLLAEDRAALEAYVETLPVLGPPATQLRSQRARKQPQIARDDDASPPPR